jgi:uncharacterized protein YggE
MNKGMKKLYLLIIIFCCFLGNNQLLAQTCSVTISTNPNTTQLNCTVTHITLKATPSGSGAITYSWSTGATTASINVQDSGIYTVTIKNTHQCTSSSSVHITKDTTTPTVSILAFPDKICSGSSATLVGIGAVTYNWSPGSRTGTTIIVHPTATTLYTVTGTASNGCKGMSTFNLVVNPLPLAAISGNASVCEDAAEPVVTFTGSKGIKPYTFTYDINNGPTQTITTTGNDTSVALNVSTGTTGTFSYHLTSVADSNGCRQTQSGTASVTVLPAPVLTSSKTGSICDNTPFNYTATSSAVNTIFSWTRPVVTGISNGTGNGTTATINEILHNTTAQPIVVNYIFKLSTGSGCVIHDTLKVTVNPTPKINPVFDTTFCNGTDVKGGIKFSSVSPDSSFTWNNSNKNIGLPVGGSGSIPRFIATNSDTVPVSANITVHITAGSDNCQGPDSKFKITVLPAPVLTSSKTGSICDNTRFSYTATSSAVNTIFSWTRPVVTGISNAAGSGTTAAINETLHNTTAQPIVVNYIFSLSTGGGAGCNTNDSVLVTVNPTPAINPVFDTTFCNGTDVKGGIKFSSISPDSSFTWNNSNTKIGLPISGSGSIPRFIATNTDTVPISANITVHITAGSNNCQGPDSKFKITVLPAPLLTSSKTGSICDNTRFSYMATSSAVNTIFSWTRPVVTGISNTAGSGTTATINEMLDNTTAQPIVVNYIFSLSTGGGTGCNTNDSVSVTVNPTPVINPVFDTTFCNGTDVKGGIKFSSVSPDSSFTWNNSNTKIGLPVSGSGSIPRFIATNTDTVPVSANITVHLTAGSDNCQGPDRKFKITVLPAPVLTSSKTGSICDNTRFSYAATSSAVNTIFSWTRPVVTGISNAAGIGMTAAINETLHNTTAQPIVVNYIFSLSTGGGAGCNTNASVLVTVNPTPAINPIFDTTFCNGTDVKGGIKFSSISPDSSFTWNNSNTKIGLPVSGSGSIPRFIATNTDTVPISANITVHITAGSNNCQGPDSKFKITVLPAPVLTSTKDTSVCDKTLFSYIAKSSAANTTYAWSRSVDDSIRVVSTSTSSIKDSLYNTGRLPHKIKYYFSLSTGGGTGCNTNDSVSVTVNPTPKINPVFDTTFCNGTDVKGGIKFSSVSPDSSFTWSNSNKNIGLPVSGSGSIPRFIATNTDTVPISANITIHITAGSNNCQGPDSRFKITVLPAPLLTSSKTGSICDNTPFSYTATSSAVNTIFSWTRPVVTGISNAAGSGTTAAISEILHNTTAQPIVVNYIFSLSTGGGTGCNTNDSVSVTVNPTPVIKPLFDTTFCSGTDVKGGIKFSSISPDSSFTWNNSNTKIGLPISGSGSIPRFIATNTDTVPVTANITVHITAGSNNCQGPDSKFKITVLPAPVLTSTKDTSVCDKTLFSYTTKSSAVNTTYTWSRSVDDSIKVVSTSASSIKDSLYNTGRLPHKIKYYFSLSTGGGTGCNTNDSVSVTVNPTPVINPVFDTIFCNGTDVKGGIKFSSVSPDSSFTWSNSNTNIGLPVSGGGSIPQFIATNTGTKPLTATITATITASNDHCPGPDTKFEITVLPTPHLLSITDTSVCNDDHFTYTAISSATGTNFSWTRPVVTGISNPEASGSDSVINDTLPPLHNDSTQSVDVEYMIHLSTDTTSKEPGCNTDNILTVRVNPTPKIDSIPDYTFCNAELVKGIQFKSETDGILFAWANSNTNIGLPVSGIGDIPGFIATNTTLDSITSEVAVSIKTGDGCQGLNDSFAIKVNPSAAKPYFTSLAPYSDNLGLCSGSYNISFNVDAPVTGTNYQWSSDITDSNIVHIKSTNYPNTVISFLQPGNYSIKVKATNSAHGGCSDTSIVQIANVTNTDGIRAQKIFEKGHLLIYPDNSLDPLIGYQWGYDSIISLAGKSFGPPVPIQDQVYQFFIPGTKFLNGQGDLDTTKYLYWVALRKGDCYSKVYYNGPYIGNNLVVVPPSASPRLQVIPNPNNGTFEIILSGNIYGNVQARIFNVTGQVVYMKRFSKFTPYADEKFTAGNLASGIYFIELYSSDLKKVVSRFIIQH